MEQFQWTHMMVPLHGSIYQLTSSMAAVFHLEDAGLLESHSDTIIDMAEFAATFHFYLFVIFTLIWNYQTLETVNCCSYVRHWVIDILKLHPAIVVSEIKSLSR